MADLKTSDPTLFGYLEGECRRQREGLELIPSENYVSRPVLEALGSEFTNKYSEGYPGRRYYGGQEFTDKVETETIERAKAIFGADHANVQVSSGAAANVATFFAWLEPGDTVLGMDLNHGGHLTHGSPVTYMAKLFNFVRYGMKDIETGEIDYDALRTLAKEHKPKIIIAGFSAYPRELDYAKIANIADEVGAVAMADMAHIAGLIAGGVLANPFDHGFHIITTTTHKSLRGPRGAMVMSKGVAGNPLRAPEKTIENLPTLIDRSVFPGLQGGPHMHQTLAIGVALGEAQKPEFKVYSDEELKRFNSFLSKVDIQTARMLTIHQMLGTRISDTMTLRNDCLIEKNGDKLIGIYQKKTHYYEKPVSQELAALIREAIRYTEERYGKCQYIFVSEKDPTKIVSYGTIYTRITKAMYRENLRDDNGNYFTFGTHM